MKLINGSIAPELLGIKRDEPAKLYHDSGAIGNSKLNDFMTCEALFEGRYVTGKIPRQEDTKALRMGSALHALRLEGRERFDSEFIIRPEGLDGRTKAGKDWLERAEADGRTALTHDEGQIVSAMSEAVGEHLMVRQILKQGSPEVTFRMLAQRWGNLPVQVRVDWLYGDAKEPAIYDLKKTASIDKWQRSVLDYGYHRQAMLYQWVVMNMMDLQRPPPFTFIVVEDSPPHRVQLFELHDDFLALAWQEIDEGMTRLATRLKDGGWVRDDLTVKVVNVPSWRAKQEEEMSA